jgi:hypothetical protein
LFLVISSSWIENILQSYVQFAKWLLKLLQGSELRLKSLFAKLHRIAFSPSLFPYLCCKIIRDMSLFRRKTELLLWISLILFSFPVKAQTAKPVVPTSAIADGAFIWQRLNVEENSEISDLLRQQYDQNRKTGTFPGYRLQLYFGSGVQARAHAEKVRADFNLLYPDTKVYLIFKSPDFIVRAGDYRSKSDALKVLKSLSAGFSNAFIVTDEIAFPVPAVQGEIK